MFEKKLILLLDNNGKGTLKEFPAAFPLPDRKTIPTKDEPLDFYKTDRIRDMGDGTTAVIYTRRNFRLNLDDYATGYVADAPGIQEAIEPPKHTPEAPQAAPVATVARQRDDKAPFTLTIYQTEDGGYEAKMGVGSEFNKSFMEACGDDSFEEFMTDMMTDLRLKAKKKSKGYIEDTTELEM